MLSVSEYNKIKWQLDHIPVTITGKPPRNLRAALKKKIHEHELVSRFPPFEPYNYRQFFINYRTSAQTLHHLIDTVKTSTSFTLDTESICIHKQPNKPALIQLQILQENLISYIILIEVCHLPNKDEETLKLIQQLFINLFNSNNDIYVWGSIDELKNFLKFNLFSSNQIYLSHNINLQDNFKDYWHEHHPHKSTLSSTNNDILCICEECLGIQLNNPWSLQDAVAYELNQWLDKRYTISSFDIGLDSTLVHLNSKEIEHRNLMITYAANDCLAIQKLLINMNIINNQKQSSALLQQPELITSVDQDLPLQILMTTSNTNLPSPQIIIQESYEDISPDNEQTSKQQQPQGQRTILINMNYSSSQHQQHEPLNDQQHEPLNEQQHETLNEPRQKILTKEERKRIHNRSCTLKQRKKYYRCEIIRRNIDRRFSIRMIKNILRDNDIQFTAVNISTSSFTNKTSLYVGIKNQSKLRSYGNITRDLFTTTHYHRIKYEQHTVRSSNIDDRRTTYHTNKMERRF